MRAFPWKYVVGAALVLALVGAVVAYAGASAEARLLDEQLRTANRLVEAVTDSLVDERAVSDGLLAAQDSVQAEEVESVEEAAVVSDETATETARALAEAREAARGLPVVEAALERVEIALAASEEARQEERSASAVALFASQMRERTLGMQLINERGASDAVIVSLRASLSISMRESDAWERAAKPGVLRQVWQQGRIAVVVAAVIFAVR